MMVEFIEQDSGNQLTVSASEFLKADKNQEEYASLAMATDAYSALFGIEYIIPRNEYDAVKSWLGKTGTVIFQVCDARYADVERGERGSSEEHLTVTQFKVEREQARLAKLQTEKSEVQAEIGQLRTDKAEAEKAAKEAQTELRLLAPKLKHMEKLAAEYSSDPEDLLPLPDRMESAKSYREKKSKPLLEKIVKVVRSVYRAYLEVCQKFELLQRKYDTEVPYLKKQLAEVKGENAELQETARDYHRLCRAYGPERVAETVAAVKRQEQAEKEQKRSQKRRHDRDAR